ncbi:MAG: fibronectin type III domain-containing protein [Elusimicrobia bacterium]|nr:fibronectin type III domain-containing protein [Elusimicrobiota bacterium]
MRLRGRAVLATLAALLLAHARAVCAAPTLGVKFLQCDGSYATSGPNGGSTHRPATDMQVAEQSPAPYGLRTSSPNVYPMGYLENVYSFGNIFRFANYTISDIGCSTTTGHDFQYTYDVAGGDSVLLGECAYNVNSSCTPDGTFVSSQTVTPLGLAACPAGIPGTGVVNFGTAGQNSDFGQAATFTGVEFGTVTTYGNGWSPPASYSMSAWIRTSNAAQQDFISQSSTTAQEWGFGLAANGGVRFFDSRDGANADKTVGSGYDDGVWHKIDVVRRDGQERDYFVDGVLIGTTPAVVASSFVSNPINQPVYLGAFAGPTDHFLGDIDEMRVTDYVPSADDLLLEYQGVAHKYTPNYPSVAYSTSAASFSGGTPANGSTALATYIPAASLSITTSSPASARWIFMAQSTFSATTTFGPLAVTFDQSKPIAPKLTASPSGPNSIAWSWTTPTEYCSGSGLPTVYYQLADCGTGATITPANSVQEPARTTGDSVGGSPNQLVCRALVVTDVWGTGSLSAPTTSYTQAAVPVSPTFSGITGSSATFSWGANGDPSYTRYEVTYSTDGFVANVATRVAVGDDFTGTSLALTGLSAGTTYTVRVRAFSGRSTDAYGGVGSSFASTTVIPTPVAPTLTGTPLGVSSVRWTWNAVSGATGYKLYDTPTQTVLYSGALLSDTSTNLTPNLRVQAQIEAQAPSPTPPSARGSASVYTLSEPPVSGAVSAVYASSASFTWDANGNPSYTIYQVVVATDPAYAVVVATLSVAATTATATNLLPGVTYYARVQAFNGDQVLTAALDLPSAMPPGDPEITVSSSPATPYDVGSGLVASWQFDVGSGTSVVDSSGGGDPLGLTCAGAGCASTPTFAAGPPGLGDAGRFPGTSGSVATAASAAPFQFADDLTVEAWVYPESASQNSGGAAGIVARGKQGAEDFALDVYGNAFRFLVAPGQAATVSTETIPAGQWTHLVGVYSSAGSGSATLYVNGRADASVTGVGSSRADDAQPLTVGNRADASGADTLGFLGRIDAVRVYHRALSAAEVLADYQGSFVSTVSAPSPNSGILVALPPNAFGGPVELFVTNDPVGHPIRVSPAVVDAGLAALPSGLTLVPNSLVEVVPIVDGVPFTATLGSSATLSIPYRDANGDNLIDGTNPPLAASAMTMYTLNTTVNRWEALPTTIDSANRRASGVTPHFSVFALLAPTTVAAALASVRVYPVPWKPGSGGRFDAAGITFDGLPASGHIRILTLAGRDVRDLDFDGASAGKLVWDGQNGDGRRTASGVYFARVSSDAGPTVFLKFAIER